MTQPDKADQNALKAESAPILSLPKEIRTTPSVTIVDLSDSTLAMGPGSSDGGYFS